MVTLRSGAHGYFMLLSLLGCLTGILQQGRQVSWTHNNPSSPPVDAAELPILGHAAAFTAHQLCLWSGCQWLPPPHHWFYRVPHHR